MNFSIKAKIAVLCGAFLFMLLLSVSILMVSLGSVTKSFGYVVDDAKEVVGKSHLLSKLIVDMETGQRGFVITGQDEFLEPFNKANEDFDKIMASLRETFSAKAEYLRTLEEIEHLRYKWLGVGGRPEIEMRRLIKETEFSLKGINDLIISEKGKRILDEIRTVISAISNDLGAADRKDELILITQINKNVVDSETGQRGFLLAGKDRFLEPYYSGQVNFEKHVKELETMLVDDETNLKRLMSIESLYEKWLVEAARPEIHARVQHEKNPRSMDDVVKLLGKGAGKKIVDELREVTDKFTDTLTKEMKGKFSQSERNVALTNLVSLIVCGVGILSSLVLSVFIGKSILKPIGTLMNGTQKISEGDLAHKIKLSNKDELGTLAQSFNRMTADLQKTTTSIDNLNREITERKKAEETLQRLNEELEAMVDKLNVANRELADFAHITAHDLKEPLMGIGTLAEWIATDYADKFDEEGKEQVDLLVQRSQRMYDQITSILAYSEIGRRKQQKEQIDLNELIEVIITGIAPPENIQITVADKLPTVVCEKVYLTQVFQNLLSNAIKYVDKPDGQITIGCVAEGDFWKLSIADNGPGIEEKYFDKIFRIFQTLSTEDSHKGTGIGLAIVKKAVEKCGGKTWVQSIPGQESTFFFTLQRQEGAVEIGAEVETNISC